MEGDFRTIPDNTVQERICKVPRWSSCCEEGFGGKATGSTCGRPSASPCSGTYAIPNALMHVKAGERALGAGGECSLVASPSAAEALASSPQRALGRWCGWRRRWGPTATLLTALQLSQGISSGLGGGSTHGQRSHTTPCRRQLCCFPATRFPQVRAARLARRLAGLTWAFCAPSPGFS